MKQSLVDVLLCPVCAHSFELKTKKTIKKEIVDGYLICKKRHRFSITKGIPRLVTDKDRDFIKTEDAFSSKWHNYNRSYHDKRWYDSQKKWFLERFGWKTYENFHKFLKTRHNILDAGTGVGNSAHLFSANSDTQVYAIDASQSIDFAYKKYGEITNIHFLQADIRKLPFKKNFFDFICSDQVLHHTKDTETSFKYLTRFLQKNAQISIYVYNKKAPMREYADTYIREFTTNMTEKECIQFSKDMTHLGKALSDLKKKITIPRDIPVLKIKKGTYDVQRFIYWYFLKCFWAEDGNFERSVGVNYDWYYPKFAYRHTPDEVCKWFKDVKVRITHFNETESGISISGRK